ncbi:MAG: substrate-binding domain-containing protein [Rhizobiaceae bacterium]|nr:substrate-binding domain-containing protein [Rhizobiaceae bacterium]
MKFSNYAGTAVLAAVLATVASFAHAGEADPTKDYAPGISTLEQLYASSEYAPPATGPKMAAGKSIIFLSCGQLSVGCAGPALAMEKIASQIGWKYKIIDGNFGINDGLNSGMRQAIAAVPDAIVVHGIPCPQILQPLKEAKAAGIPVINIQSDDCNDPKNGGAAAEGMYVNMQFNKDFVTAADFFYMWGYTQASYLIDVTQGHARILRDVYTGGAQGDYQAAGQDAALAKCTDCKILGTVEWGPADAGPNGVLNQKFSTLLTKYPDANAVLLTYDAVATSFGLSKLIVDAGRQGSMTVMGGEGYAAAQQLIREKAGLTAVAGQSAEWMAWGALDAINRKLNNQPQVPQGVGFRVIDANHNLSPAGQDYAPPASIIDLKAIYLKSWGISQ